MAIRANVKRGSAELAILALLEGGALHGYEIAKRIDAESQGVLRFNLASLYPMLYAMERHGWIKGEWQVTAHARKRRCYRLTAAGKKHLAPLRAEWRLFFQALQRLAGVGHA